MILPLFRHIQETYSTTKLLVNLTVTLYMIPFSIFQIFSGVLSDTLYGRKRVIVFGSSLYCMGAILAYYAPSVFLFLFARILQGMGSAFVIPITMALVGDFFEYHQRGKVMGLGALSTTLGATIGPLVGGYLGLIDWRLSFLLMFVIGLIVLLISLWIPEKQKRVPRSDLTGTILKCLRNRKVLLIGFLGMILFFTRLSIYTFLSNIILYPPYNLSSDLWGMYLFMAGLGGMIAGLLAGFLADYVGREKVASIGFIMLNVVISLYLVIEWFSYLPLLLFLLGVFGSFSMTPLNTLAVEVNPKLRGTASSIYNSLRFIGYALAPVLPFPIYARYGISSIFMMNLFLALIGFILMVLALQKKEKKY